MLLRKSKEHAVIAYIIIVGLTSAISILSLWHLRNVCSFNEFVAFKERLLVQFARSKVFGF